MKLWGKIKAVNIIKSSRGFTLIEVMLSVTILAIAAVSVMAVMGVNARINSRSARNQQVNMIAQEWMEKVRMYTGTNLLQFLNESDTNIDWIEDSGSYVARTSTANGTVVELRLIEDGGSGNIPLTSLPNIDYEIPISGDNAELNINSGASVFLNGILIGTGSDKPTGSDSNVFEILLYLELESSSNKIEINNDSGKSCVVYIVANAEGSESLDYNDFPEVKVLYGNVKVHNYITNTKISALPDGEEDSYNNVYSISISPFVIEGSEKIPYNVLTSKRIVR